MSFMKTMKAPCPSHHPVSDLRRREIKVQRNQKNLTEVAVMNRCTRSGSHSDHIKLLSIRQDRKDADIGVWHVWRDEEGTDFVKCGYFCQIPQLQGRISCRLFERHLGECQIS